MTKIATRSVKPSAVIGFELFPEYGYCRGRDTVTVVAGMDIGSVVQLSGGKYVGVNAAAVAALNADVRIIIDPEITSLAAGDQTVTTLKVGPAGVARGGLKFLDTLTTAQINTVAAALEAKNIRVLATV